MFWYMFLKKIRLHSNHVIIKMLQNIESISAKAAHQVNEAAQTVTKHMSD